MDASDLKGTTLEERYAELSSLTPDEMAARSSVPDVVATPLEGYFATPLNYCSKAVDTTTTKIECTSYPK